MNVYSGSQTPNIHRAAGQAEIPAQLSAQAEARKDLARAAGEMNRSAASLPNVPKPSAWLRAPYWPHEIIF